MKAKVCLNYCLCYFKRTQVHNIPTQTEVDENVRMTHRLPADDFITGSTVETELHNNILYNILFIIYLL